MPKRSEYRQGTPNWVDLQTTDQSAAKKFYTSLFGWGYDDNPVPGGGGVYSMATLNGEAVAAIAPMPPGAPEGMPPIWNTYIAVDDVDAVVDKVVPGGGQVMMPAGCRSSPIRPALPWAYGRPIGTSERRWSTRRARSSGTNCSRTSRIWR
ncbi:putative 27 kDa antigen [Mycobacterium tuberculosis]|uniref:Putative 27 kDa antigen n=1 Tax=Mycobacterium tuberculosis TaxID=1773 RepID=A0A655AUC7_MYCTX|nr:putative 27 kDa antigen [Mycobacterium tuberculosis]